MGIEGAIARMCRQTAVYWSTPVNDGYGGKTFAEPVEITCRWENKASLETADKFGQIIRCNAIVYVTEDVQEEGYLYLGTLDDLDSAQTDDPRQGTDAWEIKKFDKTPALNQPTEFFRRAYV